MKLNLITAIFILLSFKVWSQPKKNTISLIVAPTHTITTTNGTVLTDGNQTAPFMIKSGTLFGLTYDRRIIAGLSVEGGVFFVSEPAQYEYSSGTDNHYVTDGHVNMVLVQGMVKYTVFKYFFADIGLGFDTHSNVKQAVQLPNQSGLGFEEGFGGKVTTGHFTFSVNPFWRSHSVIVIFKSTWNHELDERGIKFGVGYNF